MKDKPDNVVDNPASMAYPTNVGAPAFTVPAVLGRKKERGINATHQLETKFEQLKEEYFKLCQLAEDTDLVYNAQCGFNPVVGKVYHLYTGSNNNLFLSIIEPESVNWECHGSFKLTSEHTWERQ
jgi:hypothetical protein